MAAFSKNWMTGWLTEPLDYSESTESDQLQYIESETVLQDEEYEQYAGPKRDERTCFCPVDQGRIMPSCGSTFWTLFEILLHFFGLSIQCHGFILMLPSLKQKYSARHIYSQVKEIAQTTIHVIFQCRPLTSISPSGATSCFLPWWAMLCLDTVMLVHVTQSTVRAYSKVIVHSQRASSESRHKGA